MEKDWYKRMAFYQIWIRSFYDGNGDGIGDLYGVYEKLPYIKSLSVDGIWFSPLYPSPNADYGYDISDYKNIHPDYGDLEQFQKVLDKAHSLGLKVIMDLVVNHTSDEHPWFLESKKSRDNPYSDYYIWRDGKNGKLPNNWDSLFEGKAWEYCPERDQYYLHIFAKKQPDLNMDNPKVREEVKSIMRFWLDMGCDGFRVDMASSLVKNDTKNKKYTCKIWRNIRDMLDVEYPEAALVAEWNGPRMSLKNGFDMDFYLNWQGNGYSWLMRNYDGAMDSNPHNIGKAYFCKNSGTGIDKFLDEYLPAYKATHKDGLWCFITCNHDTIRPSAGLTTDELRLAYATIFTLPGAPFVYYGDEIGMRYLPLPTKEGGYFRTGSRSPMQWDDTANHGFSTADAQDIYLPVDTAADAPTVAAQADDPDSLLNSVKSLLAFRHAHADLNADAPFKVLYAPKAKDDYRPFVWQRGDLICAVNPAGVSIELPLELAEDLKIQYTIGKAEIVNDTLSLGAQSFAILG